MAFVAIFEVGSDADLLHFGSLKLCDVCRESVISREWLFPRIVSLTPPPYFSHYCQPSLLPLANREVLGQ